MKKLDYLDYSERCGHVTNTLLFDVSPKVKEYSIDYSYKVPSSFYEHGYSLLGRFEDFRQVHDMLYTFIHALDLEQTVFSPDAKERMQLAKLDAIPQCHEIVSTGFQALHYDMGQPLLDEQPQTLYTIGALYRPLGERNQNAKTRVVSLPKLFSQKSFGNYSQVESMLLEYARRFGDGWTQPEPHNTHRLACLARYIDALAGQNALCEAQDEMIGQCFTYDTEAAGTKGHGEEVAFFDNAGLDLLAAEVQYEIKPGQLLIYDNMRTAHGRIGKREPQELINFLFGIKHATFEDIERFRDWFIQQCC